MENKTLRENLEEMRAESNNDLQKDVIDTILDVSDDEEEIKNFIADVLTHGCQSGIVGHLIYTHDTHKFFDEFYEEILELIEEIEDNTGEKPMWNGDLKNWYAWLGFEETCYRISGALGLIS